MPRSCGLMRPSGEMAQASVKIRAAPPTARLPRWTRCQSLAKPSLLEYWHMGETTMRLRRMTSRICNSSNRFMADWMMGAGQKWQEKRRVRSTRQRQDCHRDAGAQRKAKDLTQSAQRKPENTAKDDARRDFTATHSHEWLSHENGARCIGSRAPTGRLAFPGNGDGAGGTPAYRQAGRRCERRRRWTSSACVINSNARSGRPGLHGLRGCIGAC